MRSRRRIFPPGREKIQTVKSPNIKSKPDSDYESTSRSNFGFGVRMRSWRGTFLQRRDKIQTAKSSSIESKIDIQFEFNPRCLSDVDMCPPCATFPPMQARIQTVQSSDTESNIGIESEIAFEFEVQIWCRDSITMWSIPIRARQNMELGHRNWKPNSIPNINLNLNFRNVVENEQKATDSVWVSRSYPGFPTHPEWG
jgi:hypothetical protein